MILQESGENYLEMILVLQKKNGNVRSIDIANAFEFTKASVSRAMKVAVMLFIPMPKQLTPG